MQETPGTATPQRRLMYFKRSLTSSSSYTSVSTLLGRRQHTIGASGFGQSLAVSRRLSYAPQQELKAAYTLLCSALDYDDLVSVAELASQKVPMQALNRFLAEAPTHIAKKPGMDALGNAFRRFAGAQLLIGLLEDPLKETHYPPLVAKILVDGAKGLFELGRAQFIRLAEMMCELASWISSNKFKSVVLIESPLGNSFPVKVLKKMGERTHVEMDVVEWGCPRNERAVRGNSVQESARRLASDARVSGADLVVFLDDVLTGTRFKKMSKALRKAVGSHRFAAVAMKFALSPKSGAAPFFEKDLDEVLKWAAERNLPTGVIQFPSLPTFDVDSGGDVYLDSAIVWSEADLTAGKRKVNLLFQMIDQYEWLAEQLAVPNTEMLVRIEADLWRYDVSGGVYLLSPGLLADTLTRIFRELPVRKLFNEVRLAARLEFPDDYFGVAPQNTAAEWRLRSDWLSNCISTIASRHMDTGRANLLARAVRDLRAVWDVPTKPPRDYDYGMYTVNLNSQLQIFHTTLIDLTLSSVDCEYGAPIS